MADQPCARCGDAKASFYSWPSDNRTEWLCTTCLSPLCEQCGRKDAAFLVGGRGTVWRLCSGCRSAPPHHRKRRVRPIKATTKPETEKCPHGVDGLVFRWVWWPHKDETEAESEPEVISVPAACHECNCDDPFCARCHDE